LHWHNVLLSLLTLADFIYFACTIALIPSDRVDLMQMYADLGYHCLGAEHRHISSFALLGYKFGSCMLQLAHSVDNHGWLVRIDQQIIHISGLVLEQRFWRLAHRLRRFCT